MEWKRGKERKRELNFVGCLLTYFLRDGFPASSQDGGRKKIQKPLNMVCFIVSTLGFTSGKEK